MSDDTDRANPNPPPVDRLSQLWRRINQHKIVQWSVAYIAVAYALQQGLVLMGGAFAWPDAVLRASMLLLILGLPVVVTLAWYHGERASRHFSAAELTIISLLLVIGSVVFYAFVQPGEQVAETQKPGVEAARAAAASLGGGVSLAVLPFANLSGDPSQEFFSDGMTEEITSALAKIPDLRVVGRTSAFQFRQQNRDIQEISQALHASHFIEGSVRKVGDRVRITAQLIEADVGTHVWTETYDRELTDIFAVQEEIAQAIAASLQVPLGLQPGEQLVSNRIRDVELYQQYLRAKALVRARGITAVDDAVVLLEQVVAREPDFASAWALLGQAYALAPNYSAARNSGDVNELRRIVQSSFPRATAAVQRAIQLDSRSPDGLVAFGLLEERRGSLLKAREIFREALELDPNHSDGLQEYRELLVAVGHPREALTVSQQLLALEPLVPLFNRNAAEILWLNGHNDAAIDMLKTLPPNVGRESFARIYASMGRFTDAADALDGNIPRNFVEGTIRDATRLLRMAPSTTTSPQSLPRLGIFGFVYLYVGAPDRVLEFYESSLAAGFFTAAATGQIWHASYAPMRRTDRFKSYVRSAGMLDYWRQHGWPEFCRPTTGDDFECN